MATAVDVNEMEDFVTCGVCMCEYDAVYRKPKFLPCSHTICLICLQKISSEKDIIICPFCRNTFTKPYDIDNLPNNSYALQMLKMNKRKGITPATTPINQLILNWCLTCGSAEKLQCVPSNHISVKMSAYTIKNLESLLNLKEDLLKLKDEESKLLSMAIEKRKEVSQHLSLVLTSISAAGAQTQKLLDENNLLLTEMITVVESKVCQEVQLVEHEQKVDLFLSELMALVDNSEAGDTAETLKLKKNKSVELFKQKLCDATTLASEYQFRKNVKISIRLFDENDQRIIPTLTWLEDGFRLNAAKSSTNFSDVRLDLMLIAHSIFSLLKRKKIELKSETRNQNTLASVPTSIRPSPAKSNFVLGQSIFILRLMKSGNQPVGEIQVRPGFTFYPNFMENLGEFTYKSPKLFSSSLEKAVPGAFVLFKMEHKNFQPINPAMAVANGYENFPPAVRVAGEVGVVCVQSATDRKTITGWSFLFPLDGFFNPNNNLAIKSISLAKLFGCVINSNVLATLKQLSATNSKEREVYSLYVESR